MHGVTLLSTMTRLGLLATVQHFVQNRQDLEGSTAVAKPSDDIAAVRLQEAAKKLDVGLSVMKRVCRTLGLARWPYRTRASLQNVIAKTERYLVGCLHAALLCATSNRATAGVTPCMLQ